MPPKQATLGKFFGAPNGSKPAPQQSKLSFGSKSKLAEKLKEDDEDEVSLGADVPAARPESKANGQYPDQGKDQNLKMGDASSSAPLKAEDDVEDNEPVKTEAPSTASAKKVTWSATESAPAKSKKRANSNGSNEENDVEGDEDEDKPPMKKQRQRFGSAVNGKTKKGVATKKTLSKAKKPTIVEDVDMHDADAERERPVKNAKTAVEDEDDIAMEDDSVPPKSAKKGKKFVEDDEDEDDAPVKVRAPKKSKAESKGKAKSPPIAKSVVKDEAEVEEVNAAASKSGAESDVDEPASEDEDEDEKPEVAAKTREKVQSTLKSVCKDPYPDWKPGEPVPYAALCTTFSKIEMTTKRLEISAHCSLFMRQVLRLTPNDLLPTVLLMTGKLAADYAGVELGIGESLIMKAIGETTGRSNKIIKEDQQKIGDLGLVAAKSRSNQPTMFKPKPLTVRGVHEGLMKIATVEGQGSQGRKVDGIKKLLSSADVNLAAGQSVDITKDKGGASESKYIIRALEGKMRLGLADKTVQVALAQAMVVHAVSQDGNKVPSTDELAKGETVFKAVYSELPSYEVIVPALLDKGIWNLRGACRLQPGVPLKPMLAKPTKSITEVLDRFEGKDFTCEYKYDGERAQIHFVAHDAAQDYITTAVPAAGKTETGISNIFSRNSEDLSKKYPDILAKLPTWVRDGTKSFVLDCETVAWDVEQKKVLPFQQLMTRKKKDVKVEDVKVRVCVFAFDLLFLNGEALVNKSFRERRELMYGSLLETEGEFAFAKHDNTNVLDEIQILLENSVKASCEGLMVKMLDGVESHYEPSRRSQNWLKVKKDYLSGAGDSLDLVVLGAYFGKGKRTSVYGAFLLACHNERTGQYESVCNIGTGFSDAALADLHETLAPIVIDRKKPFYDHSPGRNDQPDVWFEPRFVWEVKTADLTLSPRYRAAADDFGDATHKGVSLRFPRFIRVREDKKPDGATTSRQVAEMYKRQESVGKSKGPAIDDDFEY